MFDYDEAELTDEGKAVLREILPIYCKVLLADENKEYLAEIIIDGYTDTAGDYSYNLELSQRRSLAVAQYLLEIQDEFLSSDEIESLENFSESWSCHPWHSRDKTPHRKKERRILLSFLHFLRQGCRFRSFRPPGRRR